MTAAPVTEEALDLIRRFEGLRLVAYRDPSPVAIIPTIGYGHTGRDVRPGMRITTEEAEALLLADASEAARNVDDAVKVPLNTHQRAALISLDFNLGGAKFATSAVVKRLNAGDYAGAARMILRYCHAGTKVLPGLQKRRQAEAALFVRTEEVR